MEAKRVVVGLDGSAAAAEAARWAAEAVRDCDGEVLAVHGITAFSDLVLAEGPTAGRKWKNELRRTLDQFWSEPLQDAGVRYRTVLSEAEPVHALLETARREDADLIVVGHQGETGFLHRFFRGLSEQLIDHARRPVVVVPCSPTEGTPRRGRRP